MAEKFNRYFIALWISQYWHTGRINFVFIPLCKSLLSHSTWMVLIFMEPICRKTIGFIAFKNISTL